jgi:hypothetical protein
MKMKIREQEDIAFLYGMELLSKKGRDCIKSMVEILLLYQKAETAADRTLSAGFGKGRPKKIP